MIESEEEIRLTLSLAGEQLCFKGFIIYGIPGDLVYNLKDYSSPNELEKQDFDFQIYHKDLIINDIKEGDEFELKITNSGVSVRLRISAYSVDTTGWACLKAYPLEWS